MLESSKKFGMQLGFGKYGSVSETTFKAKFSAVFAKEHPKYFSTPALLFSATAEAIATSTSVYSLVRVALC